MHLQHIQERILSGSQRLVIYLCEHQTATVEQLQRVANVRNIPDTISKLNNGLLPANGLPAIRRTRDKQGRAVYTLNVGGSLQ